MKLVYGQTTSFLASILDFLYQAANLITVYFTGPNNTWRAEQYSCHFTKIFHYNDTNCSSCHFRSQVIHLFFQQFDQNNNRRNTTVLQKLFLIDILDDIQNIDS